MMNIARVFLITNAFAALCILPLQANAWGAEGHRLIAELAERQLSAPARREATRLLGLEPGATWHGFWTGPFAGPRQFSLRWIPPIAVNVEDVDALPATIRPVRRDT